MTTSNFAISNSVPSRAKMELVKNVSDKNKKWISRLGGKIDGNAICNVIDDGVSRGICGADSDNEAPRPRNSGHFDKATFEAYKHLMKAFNCMSEGNLYELNGHLKNITRYFASQRHPLTGLFQEAGAALEKRDEALAGVKSLLTAARLKCGDGAEYMNDKYVAGCCPGKFDIRVDKFNIKDLVFSRGGGLDAVGKCRVSKLVNRVKIQERLLSHAIDSISDFLVVMLEKAARTEFYKRQGEKMKGVRENQPRRQNNGGGGKETRIWKY